MPVYFIRAGEDGPVKIGSSADPRKRLLFLRSANHTPLSLIHVFEGGEREERVLHKRFAQHRIKGEWFAAVPEIVEGRVGLPALPLPCGAERKATSGLHVCAPLPCRGHGVPLSPAWLVDAAGGASALAAALKVFPSAISKWKRMRHVPHERVLAVEKITGISRHAMRPDLWPEPEHSAAADASNADAQAAA